jgi:preflagellin peptidase FlaK
VIDGIVQATGIGRAAVGLLATGALQAGELVTVGPVRATPTDFLRLLVLPIYGWAAYRDVRTRRVPNETWIPLVLFGIALFAVDAWTALEAGPRQAQQFVQWAGLSIGFVVPLSYLFWRIGGFGGADAKALMVLAVLLPTFPAYLFLPPLAEPIGSLPLERPPVEAFSFTVLTNGVLVGSAYPLAVTLRNAVSGRFAPVMFVGRPVAVAAIPDTYGRLLETPDGTTRRGLDLDALRMYLQWRGVTLSELRADPDRYRDPDSLPAEPNAPGDGAITDGGRPEDGEGDPEASAESDHAPNDESDASRTAREAAEPDGDDAGEADHEDATEADADARDGSANDLVDPGMFESTDDESDPGDGDESDLGDGPEPTAPGEADPSGDDAPGTETPETGTPGTDAPEAGAPGTDDPWGAEAFLEDVGSAYGTTPDDLRDGLEVLVESDDVWVSPGLPFLVPVFLGLLVAFVYGDILFGLLELTGGV